ncbi:hypothetical protein CPB83DRAFT_855728 [Crepidotus variabilis]|uniref:Crinkler effector protein N-terminal domain-containing protein n=1 Tax=Crepidotus variabilis TaxID=179855 RepID=A0A9P6EF59_9AGAR|nr:hypothetical protein CPB83DRAFT_855728 [Crepidotus variabilis]
MDTYTIFCAIQHEWTPFPVDIKNDSTVGHLKDAIKAKNTARFGSIDAHTLTLYRVDVDVGGSTAKERQAALAQMILTESLDPLKKLYKLYSSQPPDDTIHILVQPPAPEESQALERPAKKQKLGDGTQNIAHNKWGENIHSGSKQGI